STNTDAGGTGIRGANPGSSGGALRTVVVGARRTFREGGGTEAKAAPRDGGMSGRAGCWVETGTPPFGGTCETSTVNLAITHPPLRLRRQCRARGRSTRVRPTLGQPPA